MINIYIFFKERPWVVSVIFASAIPLLPEYIAPLLAIVAFVFAIKNSSKTNTQINVGLIGKIILAYIAYTTIGLFYTDNFLSTLSTVGMWCVMFLVYLSVYNVADSKLRIKFIFYAITVAAGIVGLISIFQYYAYVMAGSSNFAVWNFLDEKVMSLINVRIKYFFKGERMSSTFNNPNVLASYLAMVFPFVVYFSIKSDTNRFRPVGVISFFSIAASMAFSFSRGGYLALIFMMVIFFVFDKRKRFAITLITLSGFLLFPKDVFSRFFSIGQIDNSVSARINTWVAGIKIFSDNPLFGNGAGVMNTWDHLIENGINLPHMHNLILQIISEGGIFALFFFALACGILLKNSADLYNRGDKSKKLAITFISFLAGFMIVGISDFPLMTPKLVGTFLLIGAIIDRKTQIRIPQNVLFTAKVGRVVHSSQITGDKIKGDNNHK